MAPRPRRSTRATSARSSGSPSAELEGSAAPDDQGTRPALQNNTSSAYGVSGRATLPTAVAATEEVSFADTLAQAQANSHNDSRPNAPSARPSRSPAKASRGGRKSVPKISVATSSGTNSSGPPLPPVAEANEPAEEGSTTMLAAAGPPGQRHQEAGFRFGPHSSSFMETQRPTYRRIPDIANNQRRGWLQSFFSWTPSFDSAWKFSTFLCSILFIIAFTLASTRPGIESLWSLGSTADEVRSYLYKEFVTRTEYKLLYLKADEAYKTVTAHNLVIPDMIPIIRYQENDTVELKQWFLNPLMEKVKYEIGMTDTDVYWRAFMEANKYRVEDWMRDRALNSVDVHINNGTFMNRDDIGKLFEQHRSEWATNLQESVAHVNSQLDAVVSNAAIAGRRTAHDAFNRLVSEKAHTKNNAELLAISQAQILHNVYDALHSVNHLNAHMGAVVDPATTAPSATPSYHAVGWFSGIRTAVASIIGSKSTPNPEITALMPWTDAGQCWCGTAALQPFHPKKSTWGAEIYRNEPNDTQMASLGVISPRQIYPSKFTIEHIPKDGSHDVKSTPKHVELWVLVENSKTRDDLWFEVLKQHPHWFEEARNITGDHADAESKRLAGIVRNGLNDKYVLIGEGDYSVDALNHVQSFDTLVDTKLHNVPVRRAIVRAASNHGRGHTCFYRVRLNGDFAEEQ